MPKPNWFISIIFGSNPDKWADWKHAATNWDYWLAPLCERVDVPKDRKLTPMTGLLPFPNAVAPVDESPGYRNFDMRSLVAGADLVYSANNSGVGGGRPMQNGTTEKRKLTWGYLVWGQREETLLPLPLSGWYWLEDYPNPVFDRHCIVAAPDGDVHEMIQFDPDMASDQPFSNQALGWGRWRDGKLVDGRPVTAVGAPMHAYVWTPWSKEDPHRLSVSFSDYVGSADGTLTSGIEAGSVMVLDVSSVSYKRMISIGGECAAIARALAKYGVRVIDRTNYKDQKGNAVDGSNFTVGTEMLNPSFHIQQSRYWINTNIAKLAITLGDLLVVPNEITSDLYSDTYGDGY